MDAACRAAACAWPPAGIDGPTYRLTGDVSRCLSSALAAKAVGHIMRFCLMGCPRPTAAVSQGRVCRAPTPAEGRPSPNHDAAPFSRNDGLAKPSLSEMNVWSVLAGTQAVLDVGIWVLAAAKLPVC